MFAYGTYGMGLVRLAGVVDRQYLDQRLARLYDSFCSGREDFGFYLPLVMSASSVLDVGCGTGELLRLAREAGHEGTLCGLDPASAMLDQARTRSDIEWVLGDLASVAWDHQFDLVVMTGHAFQVFVTDEEIRTSLAAIRSALAEGGRFAFETRNPQAREWEKWTPDHALEIVDDSGGWARMTHEVDTPVEADLVSFTTTFTAAGWDRPQTSRSTLRFIGQDLVARFLAQAAFVIDQQCGDWDHQPLTTTSPEIITVARR